MSFYLLVTALVGATAGLLFHRFRLPGGAMVGAILVVGALHVSWVELEPLPRDIRVAAQIAIGIIVGATIRREALMKLADSVRRVVPIVVGTLIAAALCGIALASITGEGLGTMLLATVPGGAADVTAAALDLEGDVAVVAAFQLLRQLVIFVVIGLTFGRWVDGGDDDLPTVDD